MKRLARAAEAWVWTQIVFLFLGLAVMGAAVWMCFHLLNHTARSFGL